MAVTDLAQLWLSTPLDVSLAHEALGGGGLYPNTCVSVPICIRDVYAYEFIPHQFKTGVLGLQV